jgi:hypothetical protein
MAFSGGGAETQTYIYISVASDIFSVDVTSTLFHGMGHDGLVRQTRLTSGPSLLSSWVSQSAGAVSELSFISISRRALL